MAIPKDLQDQIEMAGYQVIKEDIVDGTTFVTVSEVQPAAPKPDHRELAAAILAMASMAPGFGGASKRRGKGRQSHRKFPIPR